MDVPREIAKDRDDSSRSFNDVWVIDHNFNVSEPDTARSGLQYRVAPAPPDEWLPIEVVRPCCLSHKYWNGANSAWSFPDLSRAVIEGSCRVPFAHQGSKGGDDDRYAFYYVLACDGEKHVFPSEELRRVAPDLVLHYWAALVDDPNVIK